ncbi:hypothetical protein N7456_002643 [Penicillium angulare]|uniref:Uncharacterized protein n=1 Tax=Penicillium angulare TaxID=116970 RepID=A0A9W9G8W0_9EURO|nr:hypothetical protein N7456_002643 [Penicillium angulare]
MDFFTFIYSWSEIWKTVEQTYLNLHEMREGIKATVTGVGGSGGMEKNKVCEVILAGQPHVFPFIAVQTTADLCFDWMSQDLSHYNRQEED